MKSEKYNEENTKKVQELSKRMEEEFQRRSALLLALPKSDKNFEKKIVYGVFVLLIERAQSVIAAGYEGLGIQDLKDLAFNEYGIDLEENNEKTF